jgi:DNA-binding NarL/FixJ family response regulator
MESAPPEVIIIDDHLGIRRGIELLLREAGFRIAGMTGDPDEARSLLALRRYDVALLEPYLCRGGGPALARELLRARPQLPLVLYTGQPAPAVARYATAQLGAPGLVLKSSSPQTLVDALRHVAGGGTFLDPELAAMFSAGSQTPRVDALSPREREILGLLADGESGPEIARRLFLSIETVRTHIRNAATKLGARTRVQAVALLVRGDGPPGPRQ